MAHVPHLGWEMELSVSRIVHALAYVPEEKREDILCKLAPVRLQRAVRDMLSR